MRVKPPYNQLMLAICAAALAILIAVTAVILGSQRSQGSKEAPEALQAANVPQSVGTKIVPFPTHIRPSTPPVIELPTLTVVIPATLAPVQVVKQQDFGSWSYIAVREADRRIYAEIRFNDQSVEGVYGFVAANRDLANRYLDSNQEIDVTVTFREPLTPEVYRAWTQKMGLTYFEAAHLQPVAPSVSQLGLVQSPIQLVVTSYSDDPLPQAAFDAAVQNANKVYGGIEIRGIDSFRGRVPGKQLSTIVSDPQVFLADVTASIVRDELLAANVSGADEANVRNAIVVYTTMEMLGRENFNR